MNCWMGITLKCGFLDMTLALQLICPIISWLQREQVLTLIIQLVHEDLGNYMKVLVIEKRIDENQWELGTIKLIGFNFIKTQI